MPGERSARRGRVKRRAALVGVLALTAAPAVGDAQAAQPSDPNPMSSNVPYLMWRGEHVRLVKCSSDLPQSDYEMARSAFGGEGLGGLPLKVDLLVEGWSGAADARPQVIPSTVDIFVNEKGICVKGDLLSQAAGLAQVKLVATIDPGRSGDIVDLLTRSEILGDHQFLAGWMDLDRPTLTNLPVGGDASAPGQFRAGDDPANDGVLDVHVTGSLPLGGSFSSLGLGSSIQLPDDWPRLAGAMASDRNPDNASPQYRWDIHDDTTTAEGHPLFPGGGTGLAATQPCDDRPYSGVPSPALDGVDNCEGGLAFTRVFDADGPGGLPAFGLGLTENGTIGPFDPQYPNETFLGDGRLTPDDAPMPAARVDVSIAARGAAADLGGVGSLHRTSKRRYYSRDRAPQANAGSGADTPHNLYAPYYSQYIPATGDGSRFLLGSAVSGVDAPGVGNDFPGFLVGAGSGGEGDVANTDHLYDNWDIARVLRSADGEATGCLRRVDEEPANRRQASGPQSVVVYTDEHGEAMTNYRPGTGANYDALPAVKNANGGCDLAGIDVLGTSSVTATARYPYQPVTDPPKTSEPVLETVHSRFRKLLQAFPKGPGAENANARIVVVHAQDVDGSPFVGEEVCLRATSGQGGLRPYVYNGANQRVFGGYDLAGASAVSQLDSHTACVRTNAAGNAAVEVFQSEGGVVDVVGEFTAEGLLRDAEVDFGPSTVPPPTTVTQTVTTPPTTVTTPAITTTVPETVTTPPTTVTTPPTTVTTPPTTTTTPPTTTTTGSTTARPAPASAASTSSSSELVPTVVPGGGAGALLQAAVARSVTVRDATIVRSRSGRRFVRTTLLGNVGGANVEVRLLDARRHVVRRRSLLVPVGRTVTLRSVPVPRRARSARVVILG